MMNFLRAIGRGLKGLCGWLFGIFTLPFRILGGGGGGPALDLPRPPAPAAVVSTRSGIDADKPSPTPEQHARAVRAWVVASLGAGEHQPMPPRLPRDVKAWLPGLSALQLEKLVHGGVAAITGHISGRELIRGIPSVRPLPEPALEKTVVTPAATDEEQVDEDLRHALALCAV